MRKRSERETEFFGQIKNKFLSGGMYKKKNNNNYLQA